MSGKTQHIAHTERGYFAQLWYGWRALNKGFRLTVKHFFNSLFRRKRGEMGPASDNYFEQQSGIFTLQYPKEVLPIPDNGRYRLHNEIDDCIVCDKCAKICPVNCIEIDPIRSPEVIRHAADGSPVRIHAATFNIDMAKCCYCGLCTTVCPTDCLTMTKTYDYSEFSLDKLTYEFAVLSEVEARDKRVELAKWEADRQAAKAAPTGEVPKPAGPPKPQIPGLGKPKIPGNPLIPKPKPKNPDNE